MLARFSRRRSPAAKANAIYRLQSNTGWVKRAWRDEHANEGRKITRARGDGRHQLAGRSDRLL